MKTFNDSYILMEVLVNTNSIY